MTIELRTPALLALGWSEARAQAFAPLVARELAPARVVAQHRSHHLVSDGELHRRALLRRARHGEHAPLEEVPVVGDWVAIRQTAPAMIEAVLPRSSAFVRQRAGTAIGAQVIASNIDLALIATAVVGDLNPRRLERYVTIAWHGGALPVVLLTKADLVGAEELEAARITVSAAAPGVEVLALPTRTGDGLDA